MDIDMQNLFKHQKDIIEDDPEKTLLALGTGSSKTRIALELAEGKVLVIVPKVLVEDKSWQRENKKWNINKNLTVISKETFRRDWESLSIFDTVIADECHTLCGVSPTLKWRKGVPSPKTSQLFEALDTYLQRTRPKRFYALTATPVRSPMCVWGIAKLLGKKYDFYKFREAFYIRLNMPGREIWSPKTDNETKEKLGRIIRQLGYVGRISDWFDVPSQTFKNEYVELTDKQKKRIREMSIEHPDPIVLLGKKLSIENGVLNGDEFNAPEVFENNKIDKIIDFSYEFPQMIIFARYILQINEIKKALEKIGKKVFIMTGETKDRGEIIEKLNKMDEYIFIVSSQISAGWELARCPVMIFASRTYSIVDLEQSWGRIHRANALKKNLYINLISKGEVDMAVHECLEQKKDFSERIYLKL